MTVDIKINPDYAKIIPPMSEQELNSLVEDIRDRGQKYAVIVNQNGIMIDGHHSDKDETIGKMSIILIIAIIFLTFTLEIPYTRNNLTNSRQYYIPSNIGKFYIDG